MGILDKFIKREFFFYSMMSLKDMKDYYARERGNYNSEEIIKKSLGQKDEDVTEVIKQNGILSFPHTFLADSINPLVRTIRALYECNKTSVIALGVQHSQDPQQQVYEFSLDNFVYFAEEYARINKLQPLDIIKVFPPDYRDFSSEDYLKRLLEEGEELRFVANSEMAFVMTGDLAHYGYGYSTQNPLHAVYEEVIEQSIVHGLNLLYHERDYGRFIEESLRVKNDQISTAIMASSFLGGDLDFKVFSLNFSDYSALLKAEKPTVVASVFYGVYRKH